MNQDFETPRTFVHLLFSFKGRINRAPYWLAEIAMVPLAYLIIYLFAVAALPAMMIHEGFGSVVMVLFFVAGIASVIWINLALAVKRLHDLDISGGVSILACIPCIGFIFVIGIGCFRGEDNANKYGKNPLKPYGNSNTVQPYSFQQ